MGAITMKKFAITLLEMLLDGYSVVKDNIVYCLSDDGYFCQEAMNSTKTEKVLLKVGMGDFGLKNFITWADDFDNAERAINAANKVLNDLKSK